MRIDIRNAYEKLFWDESKDQINQMETLLLKLENGDLDDFEVILVDLNHFYRLAHSLKGAVSTMGLHDMRDLVHEVESIVSAYINRECLLTTASISNLFEAVDLLASILNQLIELDDLLFDDRILKWIETTKALFNANLYNQKSIQPPYDNSAQFEKLQALEFEFKTHIQVKFEEDTEMKSVKSYLIVMALSELGTLLKIIPESYELLDDDEFGDSINIWLVESLNQCEVNEALAHISELENVAINPSDLNKESIETKVTKQASNANEISIPEVHFKISDHKFDIIMSLMEAQTIVKEAMGYSIKALIKDYAQDLRVLKLLEDYESLMEINKSMIDDFYEIRMIPIGIAFNQFPRMIRETAKECGKEVTYHITGAEIEIDRHFLEKIIDPLTHILKNAIDHGLENSETRIRNGKSPKGFIQLHAYYESGKVVIIVEDDGAGINRNKVLKKALEQGLIGQDEMSSINIETLIFKSGMSTAQEVSKVSGRGVGLDIVKRNIEALNGRLSLISKEGMGTKFVIELPQNMTIFKALLFKQEKFLFAIPFHWIHEVIRVPMEYKDGTYHWNEHECPILMLNKIFELKSDFTKFKYLIILNVKDQYFALQVGKIVGEQEIVFKSLHDYIGINKVLGDLNEVSGVTILGNGELAYVLDPNNIYLGVENEGINSR